MDEILDDITEQPSMITDDATDVHPLEWDSPEKLKLLLEGALFGTAERLTAKALQALFPELARPSLKEIEDILTELIEDYQGRAVNLHQSASGYRFQVQQHSTALIKVMLTEKPPRYSRASLETLALIAYRQPITRGEIEDIRGVSVSSQIMKTMEERGWIRVVGHKELPGRPALWATTPEFLDYFSLASLESLPPLAEIQGMKMQDDSSESQHNQHNANTDTKAYKDDGIIEEGPGDPVPPVEPAQEDGHSSLGQEISPKATVSLQQTQQHASEAEDYSSVLQRLRANNKKENE